MDGSGDSPCGCMGVVCSVCVSPSGSDGLGAGRNRLAMPETTMPGWRPSNGASREMVPRIRWRKGDEALYGPWFDYFNRVSLSRSSGDAGEAIPAIPHLQPTDRPW